MSGFSAVTSTGLRARPSRSRSSFTLKPAIARSASRWLARNLFESLELLARASRLLADRASAGFKVKDERLREGLARNPVLVTALNPLIGYLKAAAIARSASRRLARASSSRLSNRLRATTGSITLLSLIHI